MKCHRSASVAVVAGIVVLAALCAPSAWAQAQGVSAKPLLRTALTGDDTKEVVIVIAELRLEPQRDVTRTRETNTR